MWFLLLACSSPDSGPADSKGHTAEPGTVELGATCPIEDRAGEVALWASGADAYLSATLYNRPNPWYGPATVANETCGYHHTDTAACGACEAGFVCGWSGDCDAEARVVTDVTLVVTADGVGQTFTPDGATGQMWGVAGPIGAAYTLTLEVAGETIEVPELALAGELPDAVVTGTGDSMAPQSLDATWTAATGRVRTTIPINHHAGGPTFTRCDVDAATPGFHASAEMLQPLAVSTGLEFQGIEHTQGAAVTTDAGCIDIRLGVQQYVGVIWE